jgi:hypothetical protein
VPQHDVGLGRSQQSSALVEDTGSRAAGANVDAEKVVCHGSQLSK